jgi:electron transfer flavoprotein alpha subunit
VASIVVFIEVRAGAATTASRYAVAEGRRVASALGATVYALVATGPSSEEVVEGLGRALGEAGADRVLCCADPTLAGPLLDVTAGPLLAAVAERLRPVLTLFPAGTVGAALAPPLAMRLRALYQARAALALVSEQGKSRLVVRRLRADGAVRSVGVGTPERPVVATLPAGETPGPRGQPTAEVEALTPVAGAALVREVAAEPDPGERVELAAALIALAPGLDPAEQQALQAAVPANGAVVDIGAGEDREPAGLDTAAPARLLVVGRAAVSAAVRGAVAAETRVAIAGAKAAEKDLPRIDLVWRPAGRQRLAAVAAALRGEGSAEEDPR